MAKTIQKKKTRSGPKFLCEANIAENNYNSYFKLKIAKNSNELKKAVTQFCKKSKSTQNLIEDAEEFAGLVIEQQQLEEELSEDGETIVWFATCFLCGESLSYSIIAHESLHLALANERLLHRYKGGYSNVDVKYGNCPEERLAYTMEAYVSAIINICKKRSIKIENN
jgi:hypothetical protein